jgi:hypothetical protein
MKYTKRNNGTAMSDFLLTADHNSSQTAELLLAGTEEMLCSMTLSGLVLIYPAAAGRAEFARMVPGKARTLSDGAAPSGAEPVGTFGHICVQRLWGHRIDAQPDLG